jgi:cupin 2 domain-containing protein
MWLKDRIAHKERKDSLFPMLPEIRSLFEGPSGAAGEVLTELAAGAGFSLRHIASHGAASPAGFWYDQEEPEWVALIRGQATLEFPDGPLPLMAGDALLIPARQRHRVARTSPDAVWIALHFRPDERDPKAGT